MEEEALSSRLNTSEKLLIAQAVYKFGALDWDKISGLLANHPVIEGRPAEWFDTKTCEAYYVGLMTEAGINVPAQDAARPQAKVHLRLAQKFYLARTQEVKSAIKAYEQKFTTLMSEIASIKSGGMDKAIRDDLRAVLARKFGKRLLDSWVPDEDAVKEAVAAGPPPAEEDAKAERTTEAARQADEEPAGPSTAEEAKVETLDDPAEKPAEEPAEVAEPTPNEPATPTAVPQVEQEDVEMAESSPRQLSPTKGRAPTPGPPTNPPTSSPSQPTQAQPSAPSTPASDFTPPPEDRAGQLSPSKSKDEAAPSGSTRTSKRKASTQPRGAPTTKRSTRRRTSATPAEPAAEAGDAEQEQEPEPEPQAEPVEVAEEAVPAAEEGETEPANVDKSGEVQESETAEDDAPQTRGRRATKRDSTAGGRTKKPTSPASSSRHLSPPPAKRGTSVSSVKSPTPVEERRSSRRGGQKGRGMRDEVVSKSVREQSAAVESVKEEDETEQERPPTRSSRRAKDNTTPVPDILAPLPDQRKGTRRSSTRAGGLQADTEDEKPQVDEEDKDKKQSKRPRLSSPRESKNTRKMLFGLLDQISGHRNGNVFAQPIKQKELPEYYDVIKRPMDLKKIRQRIRDSQITTIDEFERDVMLMFANATMFNAKGSSTHDMAIEMMKDAEAHIQHFKTVQHHMGR